MPTLDDLFTEETPTKGKTLDDLFSPQSSQQEPSVIDAIKQRPVSTLGRPILEGAGMAGGILATGPLSPLMGGIGGALGFAGGSALADFAETMAGEREAPKSLTDVGKRTVDLVKEGGLAEAGGRLVNHSFQMLKATGKSLIRSLIGGQTHPITPEQRMIVDTAHEMGLHLRPSEITGSDVAAQVEQNARRSIFGRGNFQQLDQKNSANLVNFFDTYAEKSFGQQESPLQLGRMIQDAVQGKVIPDVQAVNRGLFQTLQQQTGGAPIVSTESVFPKAQELMTTFDKRSFPKSNAIASKIAEVLSERGPTTGLNVSRKEIPGEQPGIPPTLGGLNVKLRSEGPRVPKQLTFMQAHDARSMLLDLTRTGELLSSREKAVASKLAHALDESMEKAATKFDAENGTSVLHDWRIANASIKAGHELFDSAVIRKAMSSTPEDVVKVAFNKNAITETERVLDAIQRTPNGLNTYRQAAFHELLSRSKKDGIINPQQLYEMAYGKGGVGPEVMKKTFGDKEPELRQFLKTAQRMNVVTAYGNVAPGQTGGSLINWFEQGMMLSAPISAATGNIAAAGSAAVGTGVYIISMKQLSKLVNSERGLKLLNRAAQLKPKTQAGARIGGILLEELTLANKGEEE